MNQAYINTIIN